jgi:hypothetical protein
MRTLSEGSCGSTMVGVWDWECEFYSVFVCCRDIRINKKLQDGALGLRLRVPDLEPRLRLRRQDSWLHQGLQAHL